MGKWIDDLHSEIGIFVVLLVAFGIGRWGYPQGVGTGAYPRSSDSYSTDIYKSAWHGSIHTKSVAIDNSFFLFSWSYLFC